MPGIFDEIDGRLTVGGQPAGTATSDSQTAEQDALDEDDLEDEDLDEEELNEDDPENIPYGKDGCFDNPDFRCKWMADGCTTLAEVAERCRDFAKWMEKLEKDGWQLVRPVEDDYAYVHFVGQGDPPRYDRDEKDEQPASADKQ